VEVAQLELDRHGAAEVVAAARLQRRKETAEAVVDRLYELGAVAEAVAVPAVDCGDRAVANGQRRGAVAGGPADQRNRSSNVGPVHLKLHTSRRLAGALHGDGCREGDVLPQDRGVG